MALAWYCELEPLADRLGFPVRLVLYRNAHRNNADLPGGAWIWEQRALPDTADELDAVQQVPFSEILSRHSILIAPTQFSATAPLKLQAKQHGYRAATMPGFQASMIPALKLDYVEINRRVAWLKELLDKSDEARLRFRCGTRTYNLWMDLRYRTAHASGGLFPQRGVAGNLPSGETYIVPYEGEVAGEPSRTRGELPVEFPHGLVVYQIEGNRAVSVQGESPAAALEADCLTREPAYGNIAELGLGVLSDFGLVPTGEILLDEKLGLHIAFGRSDHFGGQVGAAQFSSPDAVVHIDRVYIPETQPRVTVVFLVLRTADGLELPLMKDGVYCVDFGSLTPSL